jgi:hypothetical protein
MMIYYLYVDSYMFRSYDHHQAEKYIATISYDDILLILLISNISSYDIDVA